MRLALLIAALGALLALAVWGISSSWSQLNWNMGIHGWIAMILGVVVTLGLGGGLMALSFFSARRGYDDSVAGESHESGAPRAPGEDH